MILSDSEPAESKDNESPSKYDQNNVSTLSGDHIKSESDAATQRPLKYAGSPDRPDRPIEFVPPTQGTPAAQALAGMNCGFISKYVSLLFSCSECCNQGVKSDERISQTSWSEKTENEVIEYCQKTEQNHQNQA